MNKSDTDRMSNDPTGIKWYVKDLVPQSNIRIAYISWESISPKNICFWKKEHELTHLRLIKKYNESL